MPSKPLINNSLSPSRQLRPLLHCRLWNNHSASIGCRLRRPKGVRLDHFTNQPADHSHVYPIQRTFSQARQRISFILRFLTFSSRILAAARITTSSSTTAVPPRPLCWVRESIAETRSFPTSCPRPTGCSSASSWTARSRYPRCLWTFREVLMSGHIAVKDVVVI